MSNTPDLLQQALDALKESRRIVADSLAAFGDCDHSVGICNCDMKRSIDESDKTIAAIEAAQVQPAESEDELSAWRKRFPMYRYRPQDECIELVQGQPQAAQPAEAVTEPVCPSPASGRHDKFTMAECILAGECGCTVAGHEYAQRQQPQAAQPSPAVELPVVAWITAESLRSLQRGGNGSRRTVPIHKEQSKVATIPVHIQAAQGAKP